MAEQPSSELSSEAEVKREIASLKSRVITLEMRLDSLSAQIPDTYLLSDKFWMRALAVFGYQMLIGSVFYVVFLVAALVARVLSDTSG